jgi:sphingosine kinase
MPIENERSSKPIRRLKWTPWMDFSIPNPDDGNELFETTLDHIKCAVPRVHGNILVIVNPKSGKGNAMSLIQSCVKPVLVAAGATFDILVTDAPGHATQIAKDVDHRKYKIILSAGGDGTFHEILQGVLGRLDWQEFVQNVSFVQVPCGSGNALAASSKIWNTETAAYTAIKGKNVSIDVASIIQPGTGKRFYSFLSVTFGMISNLDIGTEHLRWMGGNRFIYGALKEIMLQRVYSCGVSMLEGCADPYPVGQNKQLPLNYLHGLISEDGKVKSPSDFDESSVIDSSWKTMDGDFQLFSMSNLPWLDMNFNFHPHANMGNGCYNFLYFIGARGITKSLQLMTDAENGAHMHLIEERTVKAFKIDPIANNTWLVVDGEALERSVIYGEVHTKLLRILCP